jgi:c-di-GMP-related signal transduction protein
MARYIARQAIFNAKSQVLGYEFLYRAKAENFARIADPEHASLSVLNDLLSVGIEKLAGRRKVFVNCTRDLLVKGSVRPLPSKNVVIEIVETTQPDRKLLRSCAELKADGYAIALDDFVPNELTKPLLEFADYIKIDFRATPLHECERIVQRYAKTIRPIAEKVETQAECEAAWAMGCSLVQGFFFAQPELLELTEISLNRVNPLPTFAAVPMLTSKLASSI